VASVTGVPAHADRSSLSPPSPVRLQAAFSRLMSAERETVEWGYALVTANWKLLEGKWALKLGSSPVALMYAIGVLLTNLHTCQYGNKIVQHFREASGMHISAPSVHDYLYD
jgi:hypothetical protein